MELQQGNNIKNQENLLSEINNYYSEGKVVLMTIEGLRIIEIKELLKQPVEGVLYDLNRDMATLTTLFKDSGDIRYINDIALVNVLKYLYAQTNH